MTYTIEMYDMPRTKPGKNHDFWQLPNKPAGALAAECVVNKYWQDIQDFHEGNFREAVKIYELQLEKNPIKKSGPKTRKFLNMLGLRWIYQYQDVTAKDLAHRAYPMYEEISDEEYMRRAAPVHYPYHTPASQKAYDEEMAFRARRRQVEFNKKFGIVESNFVTEDDSSDETLVNSDSDSFSSSSSSSSSSSFDSIYSDMSYTTVCYLLKKLDQFIAFHEYREVREDVIALIEDGGDIYHPEHRLLLENFEAASANLTALIDASSDSDSDTDSVIDSDSGFEGTASIRSYSTGDDQFQELNESSEDANESQDNQDKDEDHTHENEGDDFGDVESVGSGPEDDDPEDDEPEWLPTIIPGIPRATIEAPNMGTDPQHVYFVSMSEAEERQCLAERREREQLERELFETDIERLERLTGQTMLQGERIRWMATRPMPQFDLVPRAEGTPQVPANEVPEERSMQQTAVAPVINYESFKCFNAGPHHMRYPPVTAFSKKKSSVARGIDSLKRLPMVSPKKTKTSE